MENNFKGLKVGLLKEGEYVNIVSKARTDHILFGDLTGGGHLYPGKPDKSVFPSSWSSEKIMHYISDIATDGSIRWSQSSGIAGSLTTKKGTSARFIAIGTREGITIKTIIEPAGQGIITGFPI